jgi:hypothetical protein
MGRMSIATVSSPEFINITSMSPFASKCEIKVFYLGENRNRSCITKEVAVQMAQTLPGCPIVGYFSENQDDFRDHGEQVVMDGDGIKFKCLTVPYGFVAPDAKVWFKDFEDTDEFGNAVIRTYLMTEGYLWTEQYKEAQKIINEGRPQSMELDESTLKGHWSTNNNKGIDFFIINDAIFSKLCILGEDVEPCFEGASVTAPEVSSTFSKNDDFTKTLYSMMNELKTLTFSLQDKGGNSMLDNENVEVQDVDLQDTDTAEEVDNNAELDNDTVIENSLDVQDNVDSEDSLENQSITEEFSKKDQDQDEADKDSDADEESDDETDESDAEEDDKKKKVEKNTLEEKYALIESELAELKEKYTSLESENAALKTFKAGIEDEKKMDLINSFYMLSDEDKKEVTDNRSKYSLDDIEKTLSVICVRKKVDFSLNKETAGTENNDVIPTTFNVGGEEDYLPAWLKAVEETKKNAE